MDRSDAAGGSSDRVVTSVVDFLEHYGVKGMKWGHRKSPTAKAAKKTARADKKFESVNSRYSKTFEIAGAARSSFKSSGDWRKINDKYSAQLTNSLSQNRQVKKAYEAEVQQSFMKHLKAAAEKQSPNASGTRKYTITVPPKRPDRWIVTTTSVKHADDVVEFDVVRDDKGLIIDIKPVQPLQQSAISTDDILAHYGVKGMKWGKRKNPASAESAQKTSTKVKAKRLGVHTVTNADLQAAIRRMQLEQDFKRLSVNEKSAVSRWVSSALLEIGKREVQQRVAKKVASTVVKKAATGGAA
jgi:hypothetical protein